MKEEQLVVKIKRTRKYNSYQGEISPAVDNLCLLYTSDAADEAKRV